MAQLKVYVPWFRQYPEGVKIQALQDRSRITDQTRLYPPPEPWASMESKELGLSRPNSEPYWRWLNGRKHGHAGIDIALPTGTPIYAAYPGLIWVNHERDSKGYYAGQGLYIQVRMFDADGSETAITLAHLSRVHVKTGDQVKVGDLLGEVGMTGFASGPHLHLAAFRTDAKTRAKDCLEAYGFLTGLVDQNGKPVKCDPPGSKRNADGRLELADTDPYDTEVTSNPVKYRVRAERGVNVRRLPGVNFDLAEDVRFLPAGSVVEIDKWCNYDDRDEHGDSMQSWGRLAAKPYHWVAIRYGSWLLERVIPDDQH